MDLQMTVHDSPAGGKQGTTTCGRDSGTLTVCFHGLHQSSTDVLLNWQWNENGKIELVCQLLSAWVFFSFLLCIKNYIKIRRGIVKNKITCHNKDIQHLPRLTDTQTVKKFSQTVRTNLVPAPSFYRNLETPRRRWLVGSDHKSWWRGDSWLWWTRY